MAESTERPDAIKKDDTWENRAKYYSQQATKMFVNAATEIRNVALNESPPKGMGKGIQIGISATGAAVGAGVATAVGAGPSVGVKGGKLAGKAVAKPIDYIIQFDNKDECKVIHTKWLAGFGSDDLEKMQQKMKILVAFFYQAFTCYNIQFWGMLPSKADNPTVPTLSYSWEAAMQKLAKDSVHRIFDHMSKEVRRQGWTMKRIPQSCKPLTEEYLMTALKEGSSQGGNTKGLVEQVKEMKINEHKGRTIQMKDPKKEYHSKNLFEKPAEMKNDQDIIKWLADTDFSKDNYHYCYSFSPDFSDTEHQTLTAKLFDEHGITDLYKELRGGQDDMIEGIAEDLKDFRTEVRDQFKDVKGNQEKMMNLVRKQGDHKICSVVLLGDTGVGKSSIACYLANTFRKDHFKVSHTKDVVTQSVDFLETKVFPETKFEEELNTTLRISDCPGLGRTAKHDGKIVEDPEILKDIANHIATYGGEVAAFLLVLDCEEEVRAERLQKYAEQFDDLGGAFFKSLIAIFNKTDIEDEKDFEDEFRKAFHKFIENKYNNPDTIDAKKDQVKDVPVIRFDDNIEIDHDSADKPFSHDWAKGNNLEQAKELIHLIREKSNAPYRSPKTAEQKS